MIPQQKTNNHSKRQAPVVEPEQDYSDQDCQGEGIYVVASTHPLNKSATSSIPVCHSHTELPRQPSTTKQHLHQQQQQSNFSPYPHQSYQQTMPSHPHNPQYSAAPAPSAPLSSSTTKYSTTNTATAATSKVASAAPQDSYHHHIQMAQPPLPPSGVGSPSSPPPQPPQVRVQRRGTSSIQKRKSVVVVDQSDHISTSEKKPNLGAMCKTIERLTQQMEYLQQARTKQKQDQQNQVKMIMNFQKQITGMKEQMDRYEQIHSEQDKKLIQMDQSMNSFMKEVSTLHQETAYAAAAAAAATKNSSNQQEQLNRTFEELKIYRGLFQNLSQTIKSAQQQCLQIRNRSKFTYQA